MKISKRSYQLELLDLGPSYYSVEEYHDCLHQLGRIGRFLGGDRASKRAFKRISKPNSILDVGCGGGHFTLQLAKNFPQAKVLGIDISREAIQFAQMRLNENPIENATFEVPSSVTLNYPSNSFDIITTTLVCHHMDDEALIQFLKDACRIAKKRVIINDLHRHWLSYMGFAVIAKSFFPNRLIYNDGLLSIKRAFKRKDWLKYMQEAGISKEQFKITWHWAFRWVIEIDTSTIELKS